MASADSLVWVYVQEKNAWWPASVLKKDIVKKNKKTDDLEKLRIRLHALDKM